MISERTLILVKNIYFAFGGTPITPTELYNLLLNDEMFKELISYLDGTEFTIILFVVSQLSLGMKYSDISNYYLNVKHNLFAFSNITVSSNEVLDVCDKCDGTGEIGCDICDEHGVIVDYYDEDNVIKCQQCKGTGGLDCDRCDGQGEIESDSKVSIMVDECLSIDTDIFYEFYEETPGNKITNTMSEKIHDSELVLIYNSYYTDTSDLESEASEGDNYVGDFTEYPEITRTPRGKIDVSNILYWGD